MNEPKATCTKDHPWDKKTLPVVHADAKFTDDDTGRFLHCPNCGHLWDIGPDL